jgi:predicted metal-dependent hydrolase
MTRRQRKTQKKTRKKSNDAVSAALSKLTIVSKPDKLSLQELEASILDQKSSLNEYLDLCRNEPAFLAYAINIWFFSRPELLQDEKGRHLPLHTDKYMSISFSR